MNAPVRILDWPAADADTQPLALWNAVSLARAMDGVVLGDFQVSGVEIDSRDVREGDLFFALRGESTDGHRYVEAAFARGAAAVVVDRPVAGPHVLVRDTARALEMLGAAARARRAASFHDPSTAWPASLRAKIMTSGSLRAFSAHSSLRMNSSKSHTCSSPR